MAKFIEPTSCISGEIIAAAGNGQVDRLRKMCITGLQGKGMQSINQQSTQGFTPLMHACMRGELEAVKFCLENNAHVTVQGMCEMTALIFACTNTHVEIVRALLDHE